MSFIETQLLTTVSYGFVGGPDWSTLKVELFSGVVARNAEREVPLYRFNAPYNAVPVADHAAIISAFNATQGGVHGFRFKDWSDFQETTGVLGTAVGGAGETMQLVKLYTFGTETLSRTIVKPTGTPDLFEDGTPLASSVDNTTGIATFTSSAGKVITATYEFDVPVFFADRDLQFQVVNFQAHSTEINLTEDFNA